jgi:hypothetical protein
MKLRTPFLICLAMQMVSWIIVLGHRPSLSLNVTQTLFGLQIPYDLSMALMLVNAASILVSGVGIARIGLRAFGKWLLADPMRKPGVCVRCGYDIRASPIQCPECGMVVENYRTPIS